MMNTVYRDAVSTHGSYRKAAEAMGIARTTFFDRWKKENASEVFEKKARIGRAIDDALGRATKRAKATKRYIFTCAVRGAPAHDDFLNNLIAYADEIGAELVIGPLTSTSRQRFADLDEEEFDGACRPYISDDPVVVGDRVRFSPELNLTPTCVKPLEGLAAYTKRLWGVFPHTKVSLETIATHKDRPSKVNVSTGAVTHAHYSPTKAGFRAKFDHVFGAVIVETTQDGQWTRHLTPKDAYDGTFYDLDKMVMGGQVMWNDKGVEALVYGDIHVEKLDVLCGMATWGFGAGKDYGSLAGLLKPRIQVFHDLCDFTAINYHEMGDFFKRYEKWVKCQEQARDAFVMASEFLKSVRDMGEENIVVDSNHDYFLNKWLLKYDPSQIGDMANAELFYKLKLDVLQQIAKHNHSSTGFSTLERGLRLIADAGDICDEFKFLGPDSSHEVMGVELGWHGHRGANGSRGSRGSFKFVTEKSFTAHLHGPSIASGSYIVGTSSDLDLGYNQGPSNWSHTHGILYPHGHRTLITMSAGKFWADQDDLDV